MIRRRETVVSLPLVAPVDAGAAPQTTQGPLRVENAVPTRRGAWQKRGGSTAAGTGYTSQTFLASLLGGVAILGGCRAGVWKIYSPSSGNIGDACSGDTDSAFVFCSLDEKTIATDASLALYPPPIDAVAYGSIYALLAYQGITTAAELHLLVVDRYTGAKLSDTTLSTTANAMGRFALGSALTVWYPNSAGNLSSRSISTAGAVSAESASAIGVTASARVHVDAVAIGADVAVIVAGSAQPVLQLWCAGGLAASATSVTISSAVGTIYGVAIDAVSGTNVTAAYVYTSAPNYVVAAIGLDASSHAVNWTEVVVENFGTAAWDPPRHIVVTNLLGTGGSSALTYPSTVLYSPKTTPTGTEDKLSNIKASIVGGSAGTGSRSAPTYWMQGVRLASKPAPLTQVSSASFAVAVYAHVWEYDLTAGPIEQAVLMVVADDGSPIASLGRDTPRINHFIPVSMLSDSTIASRRYTVGFRRVIDAIGESATVAGTERRRFTIAGVRLGDDVPSYADLGDATYFAGALPAMLDGSSCHEQGFVQYPKVYSVSTAGVPGGLTVGGAYQYVGTYSVIDASGRWARSAPSSLAASYTPAGANDTKPSAWMSQVALTMRRDQTVMMEVWRTANGGSQYYLDTTVAMSGYGGGQTIALVSPTDAVLATSEPLYTDAGELENVAPPAYSAIALHKDRLWYAPIDAVGSIQYSKHVPVRAAVGFNDGLSAELPTGTGAVTALASLGDYLIAFTAQRIVVVQGDGRDDNGAGSDPGPMWVLNDGMGCSTARSLLRTPGGLYFQATDGMLYRLSPSLELSPVGEPVRHDLEQQGAVVSTAWDAATNTAVFTFGSATFMLRYHEQRGTWTRLTTSAASRAVAPSTSGLVRLDTAGKLWKSSASLYKDDGSFVAMLVDTGWISAVGTGGWQRLYQLLIAGDFVDPASLKVEIAYDYAPAWTTVGTYDATALTAFDWHAQFYAGSAAYADNALLLRVTPSRTKCAAFRVRISDVVHASTSTGAGFALVALGAVVGGMPGSAQVDSARQLG